MASIWLPTASFAARTGSAAKWLARGGTPAFAGRTPLQHMLHHGRRGIAEVLRFVEVQAFKASLR